MKNIAPLPHEYMIVGVLGFFISIFLLTDRTWSFTLGLFFLLVIIASMLSMMGDQLDEESLDIVGGPLHQKHKRKTLKR